MAKKNNKTTEDSLELAAQAGAANEVVNRYGSAVKEHYVAYSGQDNESGKTLTRGLKKISKSKVNPAYKAKNIKQQAGFATENKYSARQNAERIISGQKERVVRTDDLGRVNDPLYDHVLLSGDGMEILGSGEQMKFVGGTPKACLNKLASAKFQKYLDADATITVPSDFYPEILTEADKTISSLHKQLDHAEQTGNNALSAQIQNRIDKYETIKRNVKDSGITNKEAIEARLHPVRSTVKDVSKLSHRAGLEQVKIGTAISGSISLIRNVVSLIKGDSTPKEAAKNFAKDTGTAAAAAYTTAFAGSVIKGGMQNASSEYIRSLSNSNAPSAIVTSAIDVSKTMSSFFKGEISGLECLEELGEKGTGHLSAAMFAAAGQIALPIPIVGAVVGSTIGYALSSAFYKELTQSLKEAKVAEAYRKAVEAECNEAIKMINSYRADFELATHAYFESQITLFDRALEGMDKALAEGDIDTFIKSNLLISDALGQNSPIRSYEEGVSLMTSSRPLDF